MIYGKILMNKKNPSKILGCYICILHCLTDKCFFFLKNIMLLQFAYSGDWKDDVSPAGFTWPARSCS